MIPGNGVLSIFEIYGISAVDRVIAIPLRLEETAADGRFFWSELVVIDLGAGAVDLTFAALLAPSLCLTPQEGFGAVLPEVASLDDEAQALVREVRAHPAGQFALRIYAQERHLRATPDTRSEWGAT